MLIPTHLFALWFLGRDPRGRLPAAWALVTGYFYVVLAGIYLHSDAIGLLQPGRGQAMAALLISVWLGYYLLIRSGRTQHLADPTLAFPHALLACGLLALAYGVNGPTRGDVLLLCALNIVACMVRMRPPQVMRLTVACCATLGVAMVWVAAVGTPGEWRIQAVAFALMSCCLAAMAWVAWSVSGMRVRLNEQRQALTQALAESRELATQDVLTRVANRLAMEEALQARLADTHRNAPWSVALVDVDFFKAINDEFGHRAGDQVLVRLATALSDRLPPGVKVGRWGGEEFLLLLPEHTAPQALQVMDELRRAIGSLRFEPSAAAASPRVSFSAGVACHRPGDTLDRTLERADTALYRAKHLGRNRCEMAADEPAAGEADG